MGNVHLIAISPVEIHEVEASFTMAMVELLDGHVVEVRSDEDDLVVRDGFHN
tara:strand:- start:53 stop:208 length:156 start_codon:yes stop_codon:yes gene_type:complete